MARRWREVRPALAEGDDVNDGREELAAGREHLTVTGKFQSDKYPWAPAGYLPLKIGDPLATDLLRIYARRRASVDPEFARDLREALPKI